MCNIALRVAPAQLVSFIGVVSAQLEFAFHFYALQG